MSLGFDAMESFQDHVGFLYFTELTEDTVLFYFQGHGVLANGRWHYVVNIKPLK